MVETSEPPAKDDADALKSVGLWELVRYFLRLGSFGLGGPIALAGYMQRDLIPRRWISEEEYKEVDSQIWVFCLHPDYPEGNKGRSLVRQNSSVS